MNNYRASISIKDQYVDIPIQINFDMEGREDLIKKYENDVISDIITPTKDFEISKFAHAEWNEIQNNVNQLKTSISYEFYFFDYLSNPINATTINWKTDYQNTSFTDTEIYYFSNSFKNSFFKLDFYDTNVSESQTNYLSVILPVQQGLKEPGTIGPQFNLRNVMVKMPKIVLDYTGADKEGFYIYWLKNKEYLDLSEFYVSAKFFNAKKGQFVRMTNNPQYNLIGPNRFNVDKTENFYYKYVLNYDRYDYTVYAFNNTIGNLQRVGTDTPIKWYEYVNP